MPTTTEYLSTARAIAARLARTAVWDGTRCNWVGSAVEQLPDKMRVVQRACPADVYLGTAGVALFLALLVENQADPVIYEVLDGAVNHLLADQTIGKSSANYAYYAGALGVANTLIEIGERLARPDWEAAGWERVAQVCAKPIQSHELDVIGGMAGAIPVLLKLVAKRDEPYLQDAAVRGGDFLLSKAIQQPTAWAWQAAASQPPMTGYSHGAAGIALALLALYHATNAPAYYKGAMMGFNFERLTFNPQLQNWPDFRSFDDNGQATTAPTTPNYNDMWCHGAPGIALSRLRAWQLTGDETFKQEAEIALNTTHRSIYNLMGTPNGQLNFSLCHGLAGNADIMLEGGQILQNTLYHQVAQAAGNLGIERYHHTRLNWPSGVRDPSGTTPGMGETPGLMLGLAGTGYFYLRLAFPDKINSVLLL